MIKLLHRYLGPIVSAAIRRHPHEWWQLKREAHDLGQLDYYPIQGNFDHFIEQSVRNLSPKAKLLIKAHFILQTSDDVSDTALENLCFVAISTEIRRRAQVAALATVNW